AWLRGGRRNTRTIGGRRRGGQLRLRSANLLQLAAQSSVLGRNRIDGGLPVAHHLRVFGAQRFQLLLDRRARQLLFLQVLDRAALRIEPVAVGGDELALRQVAIDETAGVDGGRPRGVLSGFVFAAEDEP